MNSLHLERSPDFKYPAIELDVTNVAEHLSGKYICKKVGEVEDDTVQINPKITDCKTEDCINLGEISSASGVELERKEKVKRLDIEFVMFYHERL